MKLYLWRNVNCSYNCGFTVVLAETVQDAMEQVVAEDALRGQNEAAVKLFNEFQLDPAGYSEKNYVSSLWQTIWSEKPEEFPLDKPCIFVCYGSD